MPRHLWLAVTPHGWGHAAQVAPVVNALRARRPDLRVTVQSPLPRDVLESMLSGGFEHDTTPADVGMTMRSAIDIDLEASRDAYAVFHADFEAKARTLADRLKATRADLVFAGVPYLPLLAASHAGIPSVALSSLNWADLYGHYFGSDAVHESMLGAYNAAGAFLRVEPAMAMESLGNRRTLGPVARLGRARRAELLRRIGAAPDDRLVAISLGGYDMAFPVDRWPRQPRTRFLVRRNWNVARDDIAYYDDLDLTFPDLLRSIDAVIAKPGYGTIAEAGCNGCAVLWVSRGDWPEQQCLVDWLALRGRALEIDGADLASGRIGAALDRLLAMPRPTLPRPTGVEAAAAVLDQMLG